MGLLTVLFLMKGAHSLVCSYNRLDMKYVCICTNADALKYSVIAVSFKKQNQAIKP